MALGSELVWRQALELAVRRPRIRIRKVEAGDTWAALFISRAEALFFSWDAEAFGLCLADPAEIRSLLSVSTSRPPIVDAIKSHLTGAELVAASAPGRDRVLVMTFRRAIGAGASAVRSLIFEASGRYSTAVIADSDMRIIEAAKHIHPDMNRYRTLLPGLPYTAPPALAGTMIDDIDTASPDARELLRDAVGLGRPLIDALLSSGDVSGAEIFKAPRLEQSVIFQKIRSYVTFYPSLLPGAETVSCGSALEAARCVTLSAILARHTGRIRQRISARAERERETVLKKIETAHVEIAREEMSRGLVDTGRLILANSSAIRPGSSTALLTEWTEDGPREIKVDLDPALDAHSNAERLFNKRKRAVRAREHAEKTLPALETELCRIDEQLTLLSCHTELETLRAMEVEIDAPRAKMKASLPPHGRLDLTDAGAIIYWGLSARGNHYVTSRLALSEDLWFHAREIPGAHVILRFTSEPDEESFDRAVSVAASCACELSKAHGERAAIDFTERRHVRPIPGGGGALVTYKDHSTITADGSIWRELRAVRRGPEDEL